MKCLPFRWKPVENAKLVEKYPFLREPSLSYLPEDSADESSAMSYKTAHDGDQELYRAQHRTEMFAAREGSLNWNEVVPNIVVGSCPRTPQDVDRLVDGVAPDAILNLQSDICLKTLKVFMLPEAVRMLNMLLARGFKVYLHCTSGLAHSGLVLIGYLTFLQGMSFEDALNRVKVARKVSDFFFFNCWSEARRRLLEGRRGEIQSAARGVLESRNGGSPPCSLRAEYEAAQKHVISTTFGRWLELDLGIIQTELDILNSQYAFAIRKVTADFKKDFTVRGVKISDYEMTPSHTFQSVGAKIDMTTPKVGTNKGHESSSEVDETKTSLQSTECSSLSCSSDDGIFAALNRQ